MKKPAKAKPHASSMKGLTDLLEHGLKDLYYAEKKIYKSLPKMIKGAQDAKLVSGLKAHRVETAAQIDRLEKAFAAMSKRPKGEKCDAIDGILKECDGLLEDFGDTPAGDAAIIFAAQAVEHYEITRYGSLVTYAKELGLRDVATLLAKTLDEEEKADKSLSQIAMRSVNLAAASVK